MSYSAVVYKILIASPSDVVAERKAIFEVINSWNATNSEDFGVILMPVMWETHSTPELGDRPQAIINKQLVTSCDFLIGVFWTRIGSPTGVADSGTVEEIEQIKKAGKPVLLYFSSAPVIPDSIDQKQYELLTQFRSKCQKEGLIEKYESIPELREKLFRHITNTIRKIHGEPQFEITDSYENIKSFESIKSQLLDIVSHYYIDFKTERDSEPVNIDEGKYILNDFAQNLIQFRVYIDSLVDKNLLKELDEQISKLKSMNNHQLYLDGGASYREFWEKGEKIIVSIQEIINRMTHNLNNQHSNDFLDNEKVRILKLLAEAEDNGIDNIEDIQISKSLNIPLTKTRYYLAELEENELIHGSYVIGEPILYSIAQKGRDYLIKNKII